MKASAGTLIASLIVSLFLTLAGLCGPALSQDGPAGGPRPVAAVPVPVATAPEAMAPVPVSAPVDYQSWAAAAQRIEQALAIGLAPESALMAMREEAARWREDFLNAENQNEARIQTVERRIAALPPAPAEGQSEPQDAAGLRAALNDQLDRLRAPELQASQGFSHADGLVREIDQELRDRQAHALIQHLPSPLNVLNWGGPLNELRREILAVPKEMVQSFRDLGQTGGTGSRAVAVMTSCLVAAIGVVLALAGRAAGRLEILAERMTGRPAAAFVVASLSAILQLLLPFFGLLLILVGIGMSGLLGETGSALVNAVSNFLLTSFLGLWLVARLYPRAALPFLHAGAVLRPERMGTARRAATSMVLALGVYKGLAGFATELHLSELTAGYLKLLAVLFCTAASWRLLHCYRADGMLKTAGDGPEEPGGAFRLRVIAATARLGTAALIAGTMAGLAGYIAAAEAVVVPVAETFLLFSFVWLIQGLVRHLHALATRGQDAASLVPDVINALVFVAALPVLAMNWGARVSDMTEIWARLREGVQIGGVHISPTEVVTFVLVFSAVFMVTRLLQGVLANVILPKTRLDPGAQKALVSGTGYIGIGAAILVSMTATNIDLSSIALVAGALSVGIGFGLQAVVSNFVSGIILLIERPVSEGDWIEVGGQMGIVKRISVRSTRIETFDRTDVIVPNSDLISNQVTNWTHGNLIGRAIVPVGVAYGSDTRQVERVLMEIAKAHPLVAVSPAPQVIFIGFGDSALNFEIRAILRDVNFLLSVKSDINHEIARRFAEEKIEIPFPQRDLWIRSSESEMAHPVANAVVGARGGGPVYAMRRGEFGPGAEGDGSDR